MNNIDLHKNYWLGILAALVIILLTVRYAVDGELKDYVSFAATLASLLLAIIAILQAMVSSSSLASTVYELNSSSKTIEQSSKDISSLIKELDTKFSKLPDEIGLRFDSSVFNLMEEKNGKKEEKSTIEKSRSLSSLGNDYFVKFLEGLPLAGLLSLQIVRLSIKHGKNFKIDDVKKVFIQDENAFFFRGFISACSNAGFFDLSIENDVFFVGDFIINEELLLKAMETYLDRSKNVRSISLLNEGTIYLETFFKS